MSFDEDKRKVAEIVVAELLKAENFSDPNNTKRRIYAAIHNRLTVELRLHDINVEEYVHNMRSTFMRTGSFSRIIRHSITPEDLELLTALFSREIYESTVMRINFDRIGARRYSKPTALVIDDDTKDVLLLSHDKSKWLSTRIKISLSNKPGGIVCLDNEIYIFGGDKLGSNTYQLNQGSMKWEERATMNRARTNISNSSVAYAGCIWACGGLRKDSWYLNEEVLDSVEKYDPKMRKWITVSSMNEKREHAAAAVCDGKLFICGGCNGVDYLSSVEFIGASENPWVLFEKPLPWRFGRPAMVSDGTQLIVMGGSCTRDIVVWGIEPFNAEVEWKELKPMNAIAHSLTTLTAVSLEDVTLAIEGGNVKIFDGKNWEKGPSLSNRPRKIALAIAPYLADILDESNREDSWKKNLIAEIFRITRKKSSWPDEVPTILVFGGHGSKDMYILNENAVEWIKLDLQSPESVFMGGAAICNDSIYIFGGHELDKKTYRFCENGFYWIPCGEMNTIRCFISNSSVVFQGNIWVLGGFNGTQGTLDTVEKYDCRRNTWEIVK